MSRHFYFTAPKINPDLGNAGLFAAASLALINYDDLRYRSPMGVFEDHGECDDSDDDGYSLSDLLRSDFYGLYRYEDDDYPVSTYDEAWDIIHYPDLIEDYLESSWFDDRAAQPRQERCSIDAATDGNSRWDGCRHDRWNQNRWSRDRRKLKCLQQYRINKMKASYPCWF